MKTTDFAEHLAAFLTMYLPGTKGFSEHTIMSYRDTFKLILVFADEKMNVRSERMTLCNFNCEFVEIFLQWLENERNCSASTRNARLSAIHSFVKYAKKKKPEYLHEAQKILEIETKKHNETVLPYLSIDCVKDILAQPKISTRFGRRDVALLSILYDSGARVQEICDLRPRDVRIQKPYTVTLDGKEDKIRSVPLTDSTAEVLKKYMEENHLNVPEKLDYPLFFNHQRSKLTRAGVTYILKKYYAIVRKNDPATPTKISPHVLRHSKAMHMLQAGINLIYIRDFLGHAHVETTEIYAKADTEIKREAMEKSKIQIEPDLPDWLQDKPLMVLLTSMCASD